MKITEYPCRCEKPSAVALGYFDGVHLAHREIIKRVAEMKSRGLVPTVFTFSNLPGKEISGHLTTADEKLGLFEALGIEQIVLTDFERVRMLTADEFIRDILRDALRAGEVVCGYNYRFARGASASAEELREKCREYGIAVTVEDQVTIDGTAVSSTEIRGLLREGRMEEAQRLLSREYSFEGRVVHGKRLGSTIGAPTVNLNIDEDKFVPRLGVYSAYADIGGKTFKAIVNIGFKPTVSDNETRPNVEAHLLSFEGELYGEYIRLRLVSFMRDEQKFSDVAQLRAAIERDIARIS